MWSSPADVLDGTHTHVSDGGVATYNAVEYEVQTITTHNADGHVMDGTFLLEMDRSTANLWGGVNTSDPISVSADEVDMKAALEAMPNIGQVTVSRVTEDAVKNTYTWFITFTSVLGDMPQLQVVGETYTDGGYASTFEFQKGVTEIQIVRTSALLGIVHEKQTITTSAGPATILQGEFAVSFGSVDPVLVPGQVPYNVTADELEQVLEVSLRPCLRVSRPR
jgi:hypothetical protein